MSLRFSVPPEMEKSWETYREMVINDDRLRTTTNPFKHKLRAGREISRAGLILEFIDGFLPPDDLRKTGEFSCCSVDLQHREFVFHQIGESF